MYKIFIYTAVLLFTLNKYIPCIGDKAYETPIGRDFIEKVDKFASVLLTCRQVVGINLAIVYNDSSLLSTGYGLTDLKTERPVSNKTLFSIDSLTKAFTAALLTLVLHEKGRSWESKVRDVLGPNFAFSDEYRTTLATFADLAAHRMGVPRHNLIRLRGDLDRKTLTRLMRFLNATSNFRTTFTYNNLMYAVLAHVTELLGGASWESMMTRKIFQPLGMTQTTFSSLMNGSESDYAIPYLLDGEKERAVSFRLQKLWGSIGGSGSIMSNANDMTSWLLLLTSLKTVNDRPYRNATDDIARAVLETLVPWNVILESSDDAQYRRPHCPVSYVTNSYTLGWRKGFYREWPIFTHTGSGWGYGNLITVVPDLRIGITSSITGPDDGYRARRVLHMYIIDLLMGVEPWLNATTACTFPTRKAPKRAKSHKTDNGTTLRYHPSFQTVDGLLDYQGIYHNIAYGNVTIYLNETVQLLQMHYGSFGNWTLHLKEMGNGTSKFFGKGLDDVWSIDLPEIIFETMIDRAPSRLIVVSFEVQDPPVFVRVENVGLELGLKYAYRERSGDALTANVHGFSDRLIGDSSYHLFVAAIIIYIFCIF